MHTLYILQIGNPRHHILMHVQEIQELFLVHFESFPFHLVAESSLIRNFIDKSLNKFTFFWNKFWELIISFTAHLHNFKIDLFWNNLNSLRKIIFYCLRKRSWTRFWNFFESGSVSHLAVFFGGISVKYDSLSLAKQKHQPFLEMANSQLPDTSACCSNLSQIQKLDCSFQNLINSSYLR